MPILYESYARRQLSPARVKDVERTLTITLSTGKGVIADAYAYETAGVPMTKQIVGGPVGLYVFLRNDGDKDYIWCTIKDKDTGAIVVRKDGIPCELEIVLDKGKTASWTAAMPANLDMPNKNWNLLIEAGHGR